MAISDIFQLVHKRIRLADLKKLTEENYVEYNASPLPYKEWLEKAQALGYETERFYVAPSKDYLDLFFYVGDYGTVSFPTLLPDWIGNEFEIKKLDADKQYERMYKEKNYLMYFSPEMNKFALDYFTKYYEEIPREHRLQIFTDIYILIESGHTDFKKEIIEDVLQLVDKDKIAKEIKEEQSFKDDTVTVYRGVHSKSTELTETLSWTIDKEVAYAFANRFEQGEVLEAKTHIDNILYYIDDREEKEVWVKHEDLYDIEKIIE